MSSSILHFDLFRFWYGGCNPGQNHFDDEASCQAECVEPRGSGVCFLQQNPGSCGGTYHEWYFDYSQGACFQFKYSGCLGNGNRFLTQADCHDKCMAVYRTFK